MAALFKALVAWARTRHARVACFYCYGFFLLGCAIASVGPALDELTRRSGHSVTEGVSGVLVTARSLGYLGASLMGGVLLDKKLFLGNWLIVAGLTACSLGITLLTLAQNFPLMCFLMAFTGFASGQLDVCANVLMIKEFATPILAEPYIMALHASFAVGAAVSPVFVTKLMLLSSDGMSFNLSFQIISACFIPAILIGAIYIARLPIAVTNNLAENYESNSLSFRRKILIAFFFAFVMCLYVGSEVAFGVYIFSVALHQSESLGIYFSGVLNSAFWTAFAFGRILSIFASLKLAPKIMVLASVIGATFFSLLPFFFPQHWILWSCTIGLGLSMAPTFPAVYNLTGQYMEVTGRISALFVVSSAFGEMLIPLLVGALFSVEWIGFIALFPIISICSAIGLFSVMVALFLVRGISVANRDSNLQPVSSPAKMELELGEFGGLENGLESDSEFQL